MISKSKKPAYGFTAMFESKRKRRKGGKSEPYNPKTSVPDDWKYWTIDEQTEAIKKGR